MSAFDCLSDAPPPLAERIFGEGAFNLVAVCVVLAVAAAAFLSPLLRRAYRRRVTRLMRLDQVSPRPSGWWHSDRGGAPRESAAGHRPADAESLATRARARERRITLATGAAWLAFVLAALIVAGYADPQMTSLDRLGFAAGAGALALAPAWINLPLTYRRGALTIGLLLVLGAVLFYAGLDPDDAAEAANGDDDWDLETWLSGAVLGAMYATLFHRSLRGQVLPLSVVLSMLVLVFVLTIGFLEGHLGSCLQLSTDEAAAGTTGHVVWNSAFAGVGALVTMLGLWLGFRTLAGLANLVERGWLGELSMNSLVGLAIVTLVLVLGVGPDEPGVASNLVGLLPLPWLAVTAGAYAVVVATGTPAAPGPQLLVLRVFSTDKRMQKLLDRMQARWRSVGAVHQISGPDMVALNVDPYECAMFLSNQLHDLFLPEAATLEQLQSRLDNTPDREGRHRINEVFCFNTAWRRTVEQLMQLSDAIVLDLRGLTAEREGTSYEISVLARQGLLPRVVAVGDEATDWEHVERELRQSGQSLEQLERLDATDVESAEALFDRLLAVASRPKPAAA